MTIQHILNPKHIFLPLVFSLFMAFSTILSANTVSHDTDLVVANKGETIQSAFELLSITEKKNEVDKAHLNALKIEKQQTLANLKAEEVTPAMIEKAQLELSVANANLDQINLAELEASQIIDAITLKINHLEGQLQTVTLAAGQTSAVKEHIETLQSLLNFEKTLLKTQQKLVESLAVSKDIAKETTAVLSNYENELAFKYSIKQKQEKQLVLEATEVKLQNEQKNWLNQLGTLNQNLSNLDTRDPDFVLKQHKLAMDILVAQEKSNLTHLQIVFLNMQAQLALLQQQLGQGVQAQNLKNNLNEASAIKDELKDLSHLIQKKIDLLGERLNLEKALFNKGIDSASVYAAHVAMITSLQKQYQTKLSVFQTLNEQVSDYQALCQAALTKALSRRQNLPGFSTVAWAQFGYELLKMPILGIQAVNALKDQLVFAYQHLTVRSISTIVFIEVLWLIVWVMLRDLLLKIIAFAEYKKKNMRKNMFYIFLRLLKRNLLGIFIVTSIGILFWLSGLPVKSFAPMLYLAAVWFIFKFAIGFARLTLLENVSDVFGKDVVLYKELFWALLIGGLITILTVLAHQLPVALQVADFFNRLFMLFLLIIAIVLLRNWQVVPSLLKSSMDNKHMYWMRVVKLLCFLIPLTILSTAVIGILGYVDLAWTISRYEGVFLLILSGYMIVRGFLKDVIDKLSLLSIGKLRHGWVWAQAFLRPLDRVLKILIFLFAIYVLFVAYGWTAASPIVTKFKMAFSFHIVDSKGLIITPITLIELVIASAIIYWLSRWTREFSYRWFFARTKDVGLRNSLSVLMQYMVFTISIFISLKIIGIDLSGISYVLAGFAAGVGLGLRDLIKNYASGLLLLFERPIRAGDVITIGDYEGEVMHLGMRAMTVKTWDHKEVLVPNSETFEKPVTNWTHLDSIVRTVVDLKVSRDDDPFFIQHLILSVLREIPAVVSDPLPQVYFKEMSESLLAFEVRYYVNLQSVGSRSAVKSEVLFKIFSAFKEHHIQAPHPIQNVVLHPVQKKGV